jgi:hypothetical protein
MRISHRLCVIYLVVDDLSGLLLGVVSYLDLSKLVEHVS